MDKAVKEILHQLEEIKKLVKFAHLFKVKVHVTLNTLLYDKELEKRIVRVLKEKQSKVYEIKRMKDILEFL